MYRYIGLDYRSKSSRPITQSLYSISLNGKKIMIIPQNPSSLAGP